MWLVCILAVIGCLIMLVRNNNVFNLRIYVLDKSMEAYDKLPSYDQMLGSIFPLKLPKIRIERYFTKEEIEKYEL